MGIFVCKYTTIPMNNPTPQFSVFPFSPHLTSVTLPVRILLVKKPTPWGCENPIKNPLLGGDGALGGIQTHDLQNRNLTFYSAELRGHLHLAEPSANAGAKVQQIFGKYMFENFVYTATARKNPRSIQCRRHCIPTVSPAISIVFLLNT